MTKCSDACGCRNLICGITFLTIGIVFVVAGGVIAAVGFGTRPKDMFDNGNLSMRIVGLVLAGAGILPIIMGGMFIFFYCAHKNGKLPGRKRGIKNDVEMAVISKQNIGQNEYPYPPEGGPLIYKPMGKGDASLNHYEEYDREDHYTVPIKNSERSFNSGEFDSAAIYSEVKDVGGVTTRTKTTTIVSKTEMFENNTASGSSGATFQNDSIARMKTKVHQKGPIDSISGSVSSEIPSFNEGDIPLQHKAKRPKKHKKKQQHERSMEEVFEDTDEPLPVGKHTSDESDHTDNRRPVPKARRSTASPSSEDDSNFQSGAAYSKVGKKRNNKI